MLLFGCSPLEKGREQTCVSCDDQRLVRIVPVTKDSALEPGQRLQQPLDLTQTEWEAAVRSVMVRRIHRPMLGPAYQGAAEPAFSEEEVRYLGASLRRAFQQATAQEQVLFALARPSEAGVEQVTSGAWFVEADRIHLRLANCWVAVTMPSIRKQIWIDPLFAQAGTFYELVPGERQKLVAGSRESRNPFRTELVELTIEYPALSAPSSPPASSTRPEQPSDSRSLEEQLGLLKRLHEQELITEEEYQAKKRQLLDRL